MVEGVGLKLGVSRFERYILGADIIHEALKKVKVIRDRFSAAYSRLKSFEDYRK